MRLDNILFRLGMAANHSSSSPIS
ncbi:unnamed protein product [Linum tenue]|uniref:Uncharacterized protein n=1 Tax=Linum tenue TaxID=586396 RepID=A0AAV0RY25_9ROSI|nr:unnamed protein product [Linum tenue]